MSRLLVGCGLVAWAGVTVLLSTARPFRSIRMVDRLRPYVPGGLADDAASTRPSWSATRSVIGPLALAALERLGTVLGGNEAMSARLRRLGIDDDVTSVRVRQLGAAAVGAAMGGAISAATRPSLVVALVMMLVPAALGALWSEQRLRSADERWRESLLSELPVVAEQLGMLLCSGYSIGGAVSRLAARGNGVAADELARVVGRMRQGLSEIDALREWAERADVTALERLVSVLALNWEAADLGALISAEARAIRRDVHRAQLELIERRGQQVWVPVTVATLLPGVIFMAVPFVDAMGRITGR